MTHQNERILVTGASGLIAMHCILQLLGQGYRVRGTLREMGQEKALRETLAKHGAALEGLEVVRADLLSDEGWKQAATGCRNILHIAGSVPLEQPADEQAQIRPVVEGVRRVLQAAVESGVQRVVITSSSSAVTAGNDARGRVFTEQDWANLEAELTPYQKSKALSERAAWDFIHSSSRLVGLELVALLPGYAFGPLLDNRYRSSSEVLRKLMRREVSGVARVKLALTDVRDIASAHLLAMQVPEAAGQRFNCIGGVLWMKEIAKILQRHLEGRGYTLPRREMPDALVRFRATYDSSLRYIVGSLGKDYDISTAHIRQTLGWQPRSPEEAITALADSLIEYGFA